MKSLTPEFSSSASDSQSQPTIDSLPRQLSADEVSASALLRLVCEEQRLRWQRGEKPSAEQLLSQHPALRTDEEGALDVIYNEVVLREETGERPHLDEYVQRFPQYAGALKQQFSLHVALFQSLGSPTPLVGPSSNGATPVLPSQPSGPSQPVPLDSGASANGSAAPPLSDSQSARTVSMHAPPATPSVLMTINIPSPLRSPTGSTAEQPTVDAPPAVLPRSGTPSDMPTVDTPVVPAPPPPATGRKPRPAQPSAVAGYEVVSTLGRGGMGVVYKAWQVKLKRMVALKMILAGAHASADQLGRFRGEAEAVARLQHPGIVQIYEIGEENGQPFFSLEFVAGGPLDKKLGGNPQPFRWSAEMVEAICRAMHAAHQAGIIHRDLKPANVLLTLEGAPKITDFGLAKQLEEESGQTRTGAVMGTPSYMSPEQACGNIRAVGAPTDVYALGAILYEFLTGRPPFKGETPWETVRQVLGEEPVPPGQLRPKLPRDLETICLKALDKQIAKRYASAQELADDLRRYLDGEPIQARRTSPWERAIKFARRRKALSAALVGVTLAVIGFAAFGVVQYRAMQQENQRIVRQQNMLKDVSSLGGQAEEAIKNQNYAQALTLLDQADSRRGGEAIDPDEQKKLDDLRTQANQGTQERKKQDILGVAHPEALYRETDFTPYDQAANYRKLREAALHGLQQFGGTPEATGPLVVPAGYFSDTEKQDIAGKCYELLLVLAQAEEEAADDLPADAAKPKLEYALTCLKRAKELRPPTQVWHDQAERYLNRLGRKEEAAQARQARPDKPADALDSFRLGVDRYKLVKVSAQKELQEAVLLFSDAVRRDPRHFWSHYYLALCQIRQRNYPQAEAHLDNCWTLNPNLGWLAVGMGFVRGELGERERHRNPTAALRYWETANRDFDNVLKSQPDDETRFAILNNRATLLIRWGELDPTKYAEAEPVLQEAIKMRPKNLQPYTLLGEVRRQTRKYGEALTLFGKAIELAPKYIEGYRTRARTALQTGDFQAALKDYEAAIAHHPPGVQSVDLAEDHVQRGELLRRFRKFPEAVQSFDDALRTFKDYPKAHRYRGMAYFQIAELEKDPVAKKQSYEEAIASLDKYLAVEKPEFNLFVVRGLCKAKTANIMGAVDDYTRGLQMPEAEEKEKQKPQSNGETPEEPEFQNHPRAATHLQRGILYLISLDAPKLAVRDFEQAIKLNDKIGGEAFVGLGLCRVQIGGRHREGVALAEEAVKRGPDNTFMLYNLARLYSLAMHRADQEIAAKAGDLRLLGDLRSGYQTQALANLRKALEKMGAKPRELFWERTVRTDVAFHALRNETAFRRLAEEFKLSK
ncbi:MAG: protein kinase [Planctomycetia bacterium]|nr:protein kinase [Planctomycetia bacterium]